MGQIDMDKIDKGSVVKSKNFIENDIKGYYETVTGINWISGYAVDKILKRGPTCMYYMGLKTKPGIIYDLAYNAEETIEIGARVLSAMNLSSMTDITMGEMLPNMAASLYYICQKHYPKPDLSQIYKIEISYNKDNTETFDQWCMRVKERLYKDLREKTIWWKEWKAAGH